VPSSNPAAENIAETIIDLRSDTLTRPTPEMRSAMATAEVGDDVYGEDPTVNLLERRAAEIFGREAGLFVPTGTMGNQIAIRLHTRQGQEIVCESRSHILDWEMATAASFSGCLIRPVVAPRGILTWAHIEPVIHAKGSTFRAATGLIEIENTANLAGGAVTPLPVLEEIWHNAHQRGLPVHLDGARIFNAATTLGPETNQDVFENVKTLTRGFDTVMFCLSKGLCAPVGSMLVGSKAAIDEARIYRKALGGGMRQAGVLAAAGLIALEKMPLRLHEDHANARMIAESMAQIPEVEIDLDAVQTNIVIFSLRTGTAVDLVAKAKARGIRISAVGPRAVRLVTHHDADRAACQKAAAILSEELAVATAEPASVA
jgi:threonine aldolase